MKAFIIGLVAVVVIGGGGYLLMHKNNTNSSSNGSSQPSSSQTSSAPQSSSNSSSNTPAAATITYDGNSFSPSSVTVKSGDTVAIKNTSSSDVQFQSNPHPTHTDDTDLNVGVVMAGQTANFTVTKKGTFGYHNHLNPDQTGSITIQ